MRHWAWETCCTLSSVRGDLQLAPTVPGAEKSCKNETKHEPKPCSILMPKNEKAPSCGGRSSRQEGGHSLKFCGRWISWKAL